MKKIIFLIRDFRIGGGEKITISLVNRLDRNSFQPIIIALDASGPLISSIPNDTPVLSLGGTQGNLLQFPWKVLTYSYKLKKVVIDEKPDLVISGNWFMSILCAHISSSLQGIGAKLVIAFHLPVRNFVTSSSFANIFASVKRFITSFLFKRADNIVAISQSMKKDLTFILGITSEKVAVIYNGIDIDTIVSDSKVQDEISCSLPYLVTVGRLENEKGNDILLRSFGLVSKVVPHTLVIVGEGSQRDDLEALAKQLGIYEKVIFAGGLLNPFPAMNKADFLVLPSRWEAFPFVLLESLALELPIIATSSDGPVEILDNGTYGHLVPVDDETSLAEAIRRYALCPEERTRYCNQSRERAECFSVDRMVEQYEELFTRLCNEVVRD